MRVFVNATAVDVDAGATAIECVKLWDDEEAQSVVQGKRVITDSRGLPIAADSVAQAGSIFRIIPNRGARDADVSE